MADFHLSHEELAECVNDSIQNQLDNLNEAGSTEFNSIEELYDAWHKSNEMIKKQDEHILGLESKEAVDMVKVIDGMNEELAVVQKECDKLKEENKKLVKQGKEYFQRYHLCSVLIPRMTMAGVDINVFYDLDYWHHQNNITVSLNEMLECYNEYENDFIPEDWRKIVRGYFYEDYLHMRKSQDKSSNQLYWSVNTGWSIVNEEYLREEYVSHMEEIENEIGVEVSKEDPLPIIFEFLGGDCNWCIYPLEDRDDNYLINDNP
jgi:hypothetical protein